MIELLDALCEIITADIVFKISVIFGFLVMAFLSHHFTKWLIKLDKKIRLARLDHWEMQAKFNDLREKQEETDESYNKCLSTLSAVLHVLSEEDRQKVKEAIQKSNEEN